VDDLTAENTALKSKANGLAIEAAQLQTDQVKAQGLFDKRQAEAELRKKNLQTALDSLCGEPHSLLDLRFAKIASFR
jgi:hypothetical protein